MIFDSDNTKPDRAYYNSNEELQEAQQIKVIRNNLSEVTTDKEFKG